MSTELEHINWAYSEADRLAAQDYPYVYGGGHDVAPLTGKTFPPTYGANPAGPLGYDCSSWASGILWHAGLLEHQIALTTEQFEIWGSPGQGNYVTLWVHNSTDLHHCFLEFNLPNKSQHWSAATHTGAICGWQPWGQWIREGYTARHSKST